MYQILFPTQDWSTGMMRKTAIAEEGVSRAGKGEK